MIAVPEEFTQSAVDREGEAGAAWLADLPGIVERVQR
jgi:streptomycin 6-kinase